MVACQYSSSCRYGTALITFDAKAEARLRLKIDLCVVPVVALIFLFSFIDRANIGMWDNLAVAATAQRLLLAVYRV